MSCPSSNTRSVIKPHSDSWCMRLSVRRNVDLPQPDGPMRACTRLDVNESVTFFTAVVLPYPAVSLSVSTLGRGSAIGHGAATDGEARADAQHEHQENQHQRRCPGEAVPLLVGSGRVGEYGERQRGHRLV